MTKFMYSSGQNQDVKLEEGSYNVMIQNADVHTDGRLIVKFALENGNIHTEWVKPEMWVSVFRDLLEASGQEFDKVEGEFDTDYLIGLEGKLDIVKREGTGKHEGKTFYNAEHFTLAEAEKKR